MNNQTLEVLKKARELISVPSRWTQLAEARNIHGQPVGSLDTAAVCFCSVGALYKVDYSHWHQARTALLNAFPAHSDCSTLSRFNDLHDHAEVLALFDRAIKAEESKVPC